MIDRVVILRCKFYVGRETCAAETYDTGFFYDIPDLFLGKFCVIAFFAKTFDCCVLVIVLNDNGLYDCSVRNQTRFDSLYCTGYGTDNICGNEAACFSDLLANQNLVTLGNKWFRRSTDMLGERINQLTLRLDHLNRLICGQFFSLIRMNAAYKCAQTHLTNLLSIKFHSTHHIVV